MDTNNWRPTAPAGEPTMYSDDWRAQLPPESRQRIVNKIMETLKKHLPFSGEEGLQELKKIAVRFEEKIYTAATNQPDYLRKISLKMLTMETKSHNNISNGMASNNVNNPSDPGASHDMQPQVHNPVQSLPIPLSANQSQNISGRQQLLSQNVQSSMVSNAFQNSAVLPSALPPVSWVNQTPISSIIGQNPNVQNVTGISTSQQNMMKSIQSGSDMDSVQGNTNISSLSSQSAVHMLQSNIPLQSNSNILHHQHLKQQQEQQMLQNQQLKQQFQQRQMQLMQQQILQQQQLNRQVKQQLPGQMQTHQMPQLHQMNDVNEMKVRSGMGVKPGVLQHHLSAGQRAGYSHQQIKPGGSFPISSPQLLPAASLQHSSPQVDQQSLLPPKTGTPFVVPFPSTPLAPSPLTGDSEKPVSGVSSLANAGSVGHQQIAAAQTKAPFLTIGTPGISASPLLAEFTAPEGTHVNALTTVFSKSTVTEQPLERLIKVVGYAICLIILYWIIHTCLSRF